MSPPSYHESVTGGRSPRAGYSNCAIIASGYVAGFSALPPHGVEVALIDVGYFRSSAQNGWSIRCAPMSPIAPTPKSTHPRQLKG